MTLTEFKRQFGLDKINFYKSKTAGSTRLVASVAPDTLLVTTSDFDRTKPAFVYDNPKAEGKGFVLSNTEQRAADLVL